jgi:hypothetical protein
LTSNAFPIKERRVKVESMYISTTAGKLSNRI